MLGDPYFLFLNYDKHDKMQLVAKFKKILWSGFRATLNVRNVRKLKLRVFLVGNIVAMVTYCATNLTATCLPMIGQFLIPRFWHQPIQSG